MGDEESIITNLEEEIQKLQEIKNKKSSSVSQMLSDDQIQNSVSGSVSSEGSYGSVETAKKTACGKPGKRPRVPADSMEVATDSVVALAKKSCLQESSNPRAGNSWMYAKYYWKPAMTSLRIIVGKYVLN